MSLNKIILSVFVLLVTACGGGGSSDSSLNNPPGNSSNPVGFTTISDTDWDETAVRKVLRTFAYGGQAEDAQIQTWADMQPETAIVEMLTFDQHNLLLSAPGPLDTDRLETVDGTLRGLSVFWSSGAADNGVPLYLRSRYIIDGNSKYDIQGAWIMAATLRGLNPFRQKIGLWETNYHMAVNINVIGYSMKHLLVRYYDDIMAEHEADLPYQHIIATAASSAAITMQYGLNGNRYEDGECICNEDFAREYHQLFFGITGEYDPDYHETVAIKNTALALTGMYLAPDPVTLLEDEVTFQTNGHYPGLLDIIHESIDGSNAKARLQELSQYAILHQESLDRLPVKIIRDLADDNLSEGKILRIRRAWAALPKKDLLAFLRAYAVSTTFHSKDRIKYLSSIDRNLLIANNVTLNNKEGYLGLYKPYQFMNEGVRAFFPEHNVFGGQTGKEAADSAEVFRINYNNVVETPGRYEKSSGTGPGGYPWLKDWAAIVPTDPNGGYYVKQVAEWLWDRFIGDGLKNMGTLERAHIYALLGSGRDLSYLADPGDASRNISSTELETEPDLIALVNGLSTATLDLGSSDEKMRERANRRVGMVVNFIVSSPYIFAEEGK